MSVITALYQDDTESVLGIMEDLHENDVFPVLITALTLMEGVALTLIASLDDEAAEMYGTYEEVIQLLAMAVMQEDSGNEI